MKVSAHREFYVCVVVPDTRDMLGRHRLVLVQGECAHLIFVHSSCLTTDAATYGIVSHEYDSKRANNNTVGEQRCECIGGDTLWVVIILNGRFRIFGRYSDTCSRGGKRNGETHGPCIV